MAENKQNIKNQIRKHKKQKDFIILDRQIIKDQRLSWKAKGILIYLLDHGEGWQFYETEIQKHSKDGRDSVSAGLAELEKAGYLFRVWLRSKGKYIGRIWHIYEIPIPENDHEKIKRELEEAANLTEMDDFTDYGFSGIGKTEIGKPATNNNNNNKNNIDDEDIIAQEIEDFGKYIGFDVTGQVAKDIYKKWKYNWGFSSPEIRQAGEIMVLKAKVRNLAYIDEILAQKIQVQR